MSTRIALQRSLTLASATAVAALIAAACSQSASLTSPAAVTPDSLRVVGTSAGSTPLAGEIIICKVGNVSGTFTVARTTGAGTVASPVTIAPGQCEDVAEDPSSTGSNITVTETSAGLQSVTSVLNPNTPLPFSNGGSLFINEFHGYVLTFTNNIVVNTGIQGCTPGYWKQLHHFDSWPAAYKPTDSFNATFGIGTNWFSNSFTLEQALSNGGGGTSALGRQAVAALLSAGKGFYPLSVSDVIAKVQAAYADGSLVESTKNLFDADNNLGCPLN